ncbi:MAG: hypothetical protein LLG04_12570 [Parachlamydia sp.]|nr:hypothetical protein [Parachlamydia sp.]
MATPDIHGFEVAVKLPESPISLPKQTQWKGRSVEQMATVLGDVQKMLDYAKDIPTQQELVESLKKTVRLLQNRDTPLDIKIGILANTRLKDQLEVLKGLLSSHPQMTDEDVTELRAITIALESVVFQFARLQTIPHVETIVLEVLQALVLDQNADGTGASGFENCGYHALKNALVALAPADDAAHVERMFQDKKLFQEFYNTYCKPVIDATAGVGKRDASTPMLQEILQKMRDDPHPPANLAVFQQAIRTPNLGIYNIGTMDEQGTLQFGFFDNRGLDEAHKLYRFAASPGPQMLSLVLGNETMGHWYSMIAYKDQDGKLSFVGCDSMDNHHSTLRGNSPLYKMTGLIEEIVQKPQTLLKQAYTPLGDEFERTAGWISEEGAIAEDYRSRFLDATPNPLLATLHAPNGSSKELLIAKCFQAFSYMQAAGWLNSLDYESQLHLANLEAILSSYVKILPTDDPDLPRIQTALKFIRRERPQNVVDTVFGQALDDFAQLKSEVGESSSAYRNSVNTFNWMRRVQAQKHEIAVEKDDNARNDRINRLTGGGAEPGFSAGKTVAEAEKMLTRRINLLLLTYQRAKAENRLKDFMIKLGQGDPCLTGRMAAVEEFAGELAGFGKVEDAQTSKIAEFPATAIAQVLEGLLESTEKAEQFLKDFQLEKLAAPATLPLLISAFQQFGKAESAKPFLQYLGAQGLTPESPVNWEKVVPRLLALPECKNWLAKAKMQVIY